MEMDKRVETLETEFKLMRGELKQTLTGVRDYLLNLKLPPSQEATLLAAAIGGSGAEMSMDGKFSFDRGGGKDEPPRRVKDELPEADRDELENEEAAEEEAEPTESELSEETEEPQEDEEVEPAEPVGSVVNQSVPPVNLMANLIRWVASAKREIGSEQLAVFLEVYGISGNLSPELKEVILHLADITAADPAGAGTADVWSQLILELHGILAGGNAPLRPMAPLWDVCGHGGRRAEQKPKPKPSKLKLVLSGGDGEDKEFTLDLKPNEE